MDTQTPMNSTPPQTPPSDPGVFKDHEGTIGPVVGVIIIVALLVIGGVYYYMNMQQSPAETATPTVQDQTATQPEATTTPDAQTQALQTQSSSTNVSSIEADLSATNVNNLSGSDIQSMDSAAAQ